MTKSYIVLIFCIFCMFLPATFIHPYSGATVECLMAVPAPVIDGAVGKDEWGEGIYLDKSVTLKGEKNYNGFGNCYQPEHIKDEKDCSGTLYFLWDQKFLYLAAKITDDDLYFDGDSTWENDCTEWRWNPDGKSDSAYIGMWITPDSQGDGPTWQLRNNINGLDLAAEPIPAIKVTMNKDGYEWEMRVPVREEILEGLELEAGNVVGFTVSIGENDGRNREEYSMPCWSLNPDTWGWEEEFWGEMIFSREPLPVELKEKITATWGCIKAL